MSENLPTEEDLRSRLLLPYLAALGIGKDDIRLETAFHLQLGRTAVEVRSGEARSGVGGRLDILVRNAESDNLFIVEAKADSEVLTEADRDQGISYARLLDRIAPFVILTNGRDTCIYDSITKARLNDETFPTESSFFANNGSLVTADDLRIRYEALSHFLGYSANNVRAFSASQRDERMAGLRGSAVDRKKKYIPELYQPRAEAGQRLDRFIDGPGAFLALVGPSGVGKTNEVCALAERLGSSHVVIFLAARDLHASLAMSLVDEFNWHFSDRLAISELVRRLDEIAIRTKQSVVIIVDGIDEASVPLFELSLGDFAARLRQFEGRVKLVVSCKSEVWGRFAFNRGDPSQLLGSLDTSWQDPPGAGAPSITPRPLSLTPFSDDELSSVLPRYKATFGLTETPSGQLRDHCRSPFLLRITAEVYSNSVQQLPADLSEAVLIRSWLEAKLEGSRSSAIARAELEAIGRALHRHTVGLHGKRITFGEMERVPEQLVRELARAPSDAPFGDELVNQGIVVRQEDHEGRKYVSFYFGRVRDYVIARLTLKLDALTPDEFQALLPELLTNYVLESSLFWHLRTAPDTHRRILHQTIAGRAADFAATYQRIFDEALVGAKVGVEPHTTGDIGIAYETDDEGLRSYGLFPVGERSTDRVLELRPAYDGTPWPFSRDLYLLGGTNARGGGHNFANTDPVEAAAVHALERLIEATREGRLDETGSSTLMTESIIALCTEHRKRLGLPDPRSYQAFIAGVTPIDIDAVAQRLHAYFGREFYDRLWVDEQVLRGSQWVKRSEDGRTYTITHDPTVQQEIARRADAEAATGRRFPPPRILGHEDLGVLAELLDTNKHRSVDSPLLPPPDIAGSYSDHRAFWAYSDHQMRNLLETIFIEGVRAYAYLVDRNLPGLRQALPFYRKLPVTVVVDYRRPRHDDRDSWGTLKYAYFSKGTESKAEVHIDSTEAVFRLGATERFQVLLGGKLVSAPGWGGTGLQSLLTPYHAPGFRSGAQGRGAAGRCPIRAFAYKIITHELKELSARDLLTAIGAEVKPSR